MLRDWRAYLRRLRSNGFKRCKSGERARQISLRLAFICSIIACLCRSVRSASCIEQDAVNSGSLLRQELCPCGPCRTRRPFRSHMVSCVHGDVVGIEQYFVVKGKTVLPDPWLGRLLDYFSRDATSDP